MNRQYRSSGANLEAGRTPRLLALALVPLLLVGCATKRDLRDLRSEVVALQLRQDSLFAVLEAQNDLLMDSVSGNREFILAARGELARQLLAMEDQLVQIQELTGQSQRRINELRQQMESRAGQMETPSTTPGTSTPGTTPSGNDPEQIYQLGRAQLERGNARTARQAFEMLLSQHATHRLAPDAQFGIAESWVQEDPARALREFERVQELFPSSARAPAALYRAGVIARDRNDTAKAREYFQRVVRGYPGSEEARAASDALSRLR
jgi:TolA-binding protein